MHRALTILLPIFIWDYDENIIIIMAYLFQAIIGIFRIKAFAPSIGIVYLRMMKTVYISVKSKKQVNQKWCLTFL